MVYNQEHVGPMEWPNHVIKSQKRQWYISSIIQHAEIWPGGVRNVYCIRSDLDLVRSWHIYSIVEQFWAVTNTEVSGLMKLTPGEGEATSR